MAFHIPEFAQFVFHFMKPFLFQGRNTRNVKIAVNKNGKKIEKCSKRKMMSLRI